MIALTEPPQYPHVTVELSHLGGRPVAAIAMVRRTLQRAGLQEVAGKWTEEAMELEEDQILPAARRYVTVT
ncbi:MAG: hypothetical protein QNK37_14780 [Acidobacteriota bacterium]|nr:hypothetical protein [Acidobacteriota bacterium]